MGDVPTRIERVELRCSNVEASADFYSRLVGLEVTSLGAGRAELTAAGDSGALLVLHRAERPGRLVGPATGLFHTAFRYPDRAGLAHALARIDEIRAAFTGASDHGVSEALYLDDPDGLGIELYRDRPRERWPEPGPGERVSMFTARLDLADLAGATAEGSGDAAPDVGHVHLKVADTAAAERFWFEEVGMDLMTRFGDQASFLGLDGYHHHIGANSWHSRGAAPAPEDRVGIAAFAVRTDNAPAALRTPDGIAVELVADGAPR